MNLNQQLEDKKKELENLLKSMDGYGYSREDTIKDFEKWDYDMFGDKEDVRKYHKLTAEIAILEQAITEIKKQRQEILDKIDVLYKDFLSRNDEFLPEIVSPQLQGILMGISMVKSDIEKLNQPKTEE